MDDPTIRDTLAVERTRLSNERTLLAYVRTALALLAAGAALLEFSADPLLRAVAWPLVVAGVVTLTLGLVRFARVRGRLAARR